MEHSTSLTVQPRMKAKKRIPQPALETGQIWRLEAAAIHISEVGKRLVHYKLIKGNYTRGPASTTTKEVLEKHLKAKKAVWLPG